MDTATVDSPLRVVAKDAVAKDVIVLTLQHVERRRLADWSPGAHIDLVLPNGVTRQYSLCGDRWDPLNYRIAVLREPDGKGGSSFIHDHLNVGDRVGLGGPRNNFPLAPSDKYVFIAGGIGITPLIPMIEQAELLGASWQLLYGGRTRRSMAFLDELSYFGDKVTIFPADERGLLPLAAWLADAAEVDTKVYACGPRQLLDVIETYCRDWPIGKFRTERFIARERVAPVRSTSFEVELARAGRTVTVTPHASVLEAIHGVGVKVLSSCREGICGTCEATVLSGVPDHRDSILEDDERSLNNRMFLCVSRSCSDKLVLDL